MKKQTKSRKILAMLSEGMTTAQIVKQLKVSPAYVYTIKSLNKNKKNAAKAASIGKQDIPTPLQDIPTPLQDFATRVDGKGSSPDETQVGGDHYKDNEIQVWDAIHDWGLGYFSGNVIKYVARHRKKNGVEDLKKARHYLDKLIAMSEKQGK
jgi:hypothetical protein